MLPKLDHPVLVKLVTFREALNLQWIKPILIIFGCSLLMSACSEREEILLGKRYDIRSDVVSTSAEAQENTSKEIRLPQQINNASWPQAFGTPAFRTDHPALSPTVSLRWSTNIGAGDSRKQRIVANPVVGGGLIYTLDSDALLSSVSSTGQVLWSRDLRPIRDSRGDATGGGLAYSNEVLYVTLGYGEVSALDAKTGELIWRQKLNATGSGSPLVSDGLVYVVAGDDTAWAIQADNGRIAWQISATPSISNILGSPAPVRAGRSVVFAFGAGDLVAAFPRSGLRRWAASLLTSQRGRALSRISDITGSPVVVGDRIFAGNHSGQIVAFDADNGERIWTVRRGALDSLWPAGDSVFVITDRNELMRLQATTGEKIWEFELPDFVSDRPNRRDKIYANHGPVLAGGRLIVTSSDGLIRFFSPQDGRLLSTVNIPNGATTAPVVANNTLYVVSTNGQLHAFR
ncbi:MAG: PQQ-binding-like beta-propeller repeat protein [Aestuariivita sp.]|nr:PQQ-binding-like beta-propeller repeat protein [Aestuariivita sp.]